MKMKSIGVFLIAAVLVWLMFFSYSSLKYINQTFKTELETEYADSIYATYWAWFKDEHHTKKVDSIVLLSRYVAYRLYKDKTSNFLLRFFYESFIRINLDKKEKINIMLSTDIYEGGAKGMKNASIKYFGKDPAELSDNELYKLFKKIY